MEAEAMEGYLNILDCSLSSPTISENSVHNSALDSVLTKLVGINWFQLYRVGGNASPTNNHRFIEQFNHIFANDVSVKTHINSLVESEVTSGLLNPQYREERRDQLHKWLYDFYLREIQGIANTTKSTISNHFILLKIAYITFANILSKIFKDGIWIHESSFQTFQSRLRSNENILLLPNHKSHIDYIILHFLFVRFNIETPVVIAGENLNVPIFGPALLKLGALFIKRKFSNNKDFYYLNTIENLIKLKINTNTRIELFIEGTRSRNGKLMHPKTGFVNILIDNIGKNHGDDSNNILMQPISLVYEKPYEFDEYLIELNGLDKKQESFASMLKAGLRFFFGSSSTQESHNYGKLVINFDVNVINFITGRLDKDERSVMALTETVLERIHDTSYVTVISVLCLALSLLFYQHNEAIAEIKKHDVIHVFKILVFKLKEKKAILENHELDLLSHLGNDQLIAEFDHLLIKFIHSSTSVKLGKEIEIKPLTYLIRNETSLTYFKNSLLNNFILEMFLTKVSQNRKTDIPDEKELKILKSLFKFEFLTSLIDDASVRNYRRTDVDDQLFGHLLNPFIESYELVADNLKHVISITMKEWFHLLYGSNITKSTRYKESLNKSNLMYAIYTFQDLKLLKVVNGNEITVLDDDGLSLLTDYLHALRTDGALSMRLRESVFVRFFSHPSRL